MKTFRFIFGNFTAKIISLLIAVGIWVYVGSGFAQIGNFPGNISIDFLNVPQDLVAVSDSSSVSVKIVAAANIWRNLNDDSFSATVDLYNLNQGTYELPVQVSSRNPDVQIVEVNPKKIIVRLEKISSKEIPVVLQVEGKPASGLAVGDWKLSPARVQISGASSVLEKIMQATAKISLNGEKDSLQRMVKPLALDSSGNEIKNIQFSPSEIEAEIPLVQASSAKTVGVKVATTGQVTDGFWISGFETQPSSVAITASASLINDISFVETQKVNVTGLSNVKEFITTLNPAAGVTVLDNISQVKVRVLVSPINSTRQFEAGFYWKNLNPNLKVVSATPDKASLIVTGSTQDLSRITSKDVIINVDLGSFYGPGTYTVDILRSNVVLPSGISFSSIVPSAITVRLENL